VKNSIDSVSVNNGIVGAVAGNPQVVRDIQVACYRSVFVDTAN
jgi:hypothetical protein